MNKTPESQSLALWLREAISVSGYKQNALSRAMLAKLGRNNDDSLINKMVRGVKSIDGDELLAISELTGHPIPTSTGDGEFTVPVVGKVGAGSEMVLYDTGHDTAQRVTAPDGASKTSVAAEISGTSLGPIFDGWYVFYDDVHSPITSGMIGRLCVVGLADGRVLVKRVSAGQLPDRYNLSANTEPPIYDAEIVWAAVVSHIAYR